MRYAIVYEFPDGFQPFDLPSILARDVGRVPPTSHAFQMRIAADQYVAMVELAHRTGGRVEKLPIT